jgi:hypothetical protein
MTYDAIIVGYNYLAECMTSALPVPENKLSLPNQSASFLARITVYVLDGNNIQYGLC